MLRELSTLLDELHDGLTAIETRSGVRLANVDMTLPLDLRPVFRDGGCVLLADVPRSSGIDAWLVSPSKLTIGWSSAGDVVNDASESAFARHPGEGGDPATLLSPTTAHVPAQAGSLDPRLRGDDGLKDDGLKSAVDPRPSALIRVKRSLSTSTPEGTP